jgi:uncharacterized protein YgiM (DUF1202 family)
MRHPIKRFLPVFVAFFLLPAQNGIARVPTNVCESSFRVIKTPDGSNVSLRMSIGNNAPTMGSLPNGTEVLFNLSDRTGQWAEITAPSGLTGMVPTRFLVSSPAGRSHFNGSMRVKTLDGGSLNIRAEPALGARVIGSLANDVVVKYNDSVGYWSNVTASNGIRGYVVSKYLICN